MKQVFNLKICVCIHAKYQIDHDKCIIFCMHMDLDYVLRRNMCSPNSNDHVPQDSCLECPATLHRHADSCMVNTCHLTRSCGSTKSLAETGGFANQSPLITINPFV